MECVDCGKQILPNEGAYTTYAFGGAGLVHHSSCGDPFGLKAKDAEITSLRAELAAMNKRWTDAEYELRAAARQDAEEKARLTSALKGIEVALARDEDVDGAMKIVLAALACRPQGEKS